MPDETSFWQRPWELRAPAFEITGGLFYVGNTDVSCHLLIGREKTLLIDTAFAETTYLLTESIRSVGVDPAGAPYLLFRLGDAYGTTTYRHKLARWKDGRWETLDIGPAVDCGYADYPRDDNFTLQVLSRTHLRAYVANITAGEPVKTELQQWESGDSGGTWTQTRTIFRSTAIPARYVLISPKLVADAHPDGYLVFGETKRYLWGDSGYVKRPQPDR